MKPIKTHSTGSVLLPTIQSLILGFAILLMSSCAEDGVTEQEPQIFVLPISQELVVSTLSGQVIDEQGVAVAGAVVDYLSGVIPAQTLTDDYGNFLIENAQNKGKAAYISITSPGKFRAFRKFSLVAGKHNYTEVMMLDQELIGTVDAANGGTLSRGDGSSIRLPGGGIVDQDGQTYDGAVRVAMTWIDPSSDDLARRMIGDLSGLDEDGNYRSLGSFGMLQVELSDASGNILNIANEELAELTFPIPQSMLSKAESTIPLWSYNEDIGTWIQEGIAIKSGNKYVGSVSHFSSWNVDIMTDPIEIKGQVLINTEGGGAVGGGYLQVYVCGESFNRKGGWLCDDGSFRFYNFPKGEVFDIKVLDRCNDEIFKESFGPFDQDKDLGAITVGVSTNIVRISGNALDCDEMPLTDGRLAVFQGDRRFEFPIDEEGKFDFSFDFCGAQAATMEVVNVVDLLSESIELSSDQGDVEVVDLKICDELFDFISISADGDTPVVYTPFVSIEISEKLSLPSCKSVRIAFRQEDTSIDTPGLSPSLVLEFDVDENTLEVIGTPGLSYLYETTTCKMNSDGSSAMTVDIIDFGTAVGDVVKGTFRAEKVQCLDWFDGTLREVLVEGEFSVPIR